MFRKKNLFVFINIMEETKGSNTSRMIQWLETRPMLWRISSSKKLTNILIKRPKKK